MVRDRKRPAVLITDAPEDPEKELRRREVRYITMMLLRAACLVGAAVLVSLKPPLWGLWVVLSLVAMLLLPWFAVLLANDAPAKKRPRHPAPAPAAPAVSQLSLPAPRADRTIDADL